MTLASMLACDETKKKRAVAWHLYLDHAGAGPAGQSSPGTWSGTLAVGLVGHRVAASGRCASVSGGNVQ